MASYDRKLLVPYLQDICALELAKKQCEDKIALLNTKEAEARRALERQPQAKLIEHSYHFSFLWSVAQLGLFVFFVSVVMCLFENDYGYLVFICDVYVVLFLVFMYVVFVLVTFWDQCSRNGKSKRAWKRERNALSTELESTRRTQKAEVPGLQREIHVIEGLLAKSYGANLIPGRYRELYAAVYLYDWFSTSQADNMDMALNTYVLEQIKSRLDAIIQNQSTQIIQQRRILANQAQMSGMIERNAERMRDSVAQMNESIEKQNVYLNMIDSNVAATRYFAEEAYKKWY